MDDTEPEDRLLNSLSDVVGIPEPGLLISVAVSSCRPTSTGTVAYGEAAPSEKFTKLEYSSDKAALRSLLASRQTVSLDAIT